MTYTSLCKAVQAFHTCQHESGFIVNCCIKCKTVIVIFEEKCIKFVLTNSECKVGPVVNYFFFQGFWKYIFLFAYDTSVLS